MAVEKASKRLSQVPSFGTIVSSWRRSLVNPGDFHTPTAYYAFGETQKVTTGARKYRYKYGDEWFTSEQLVIPYEVSLRYDSDEPVQGNDLRYPRPGPTDVSQWNELGERSLQHLISQVMKDKGSDFNAGVFGAEAKESLNMITHTATRTFRALRALRKGDLNGMYSVLGVSSPRRTPRNSRQPVHGISHSQTAAGYWNEVSYGWMPLLQDTYAASTKLAQMVIDQRPIFLVENGKKKQIAKSTQLYSEPERNVRVFLSEFMAHRSGLAFRYGNRTIAQMSSLGLTNPMLIAWEVIPLSFVFDWWLPVGNFLEKLSAFHGMEFQAGYTSSLLRQTTTTSQAAWRKDHTFSPTPEGGVSLTSYTEAEGCRYQLSRWSFTRGVMTDFPSVSFPKPADSPISLTRAISAVALLRQRLW